MRRTRRLILAATAAGAVAVATAAATALPAGAAATADRSSAGEFMQTNLVSDRSDQGAQLVDPNLKNPWGLAFSATSPLWVSDNNAAAATLYSIAPGGTSVKQVPLTVMLPGGRVSTGDGGSPTGQVFNGGTGFVVTTAAGSGPARFIFSAEAGQITAWNPAADPTTAGVSTATVEYSSPTAVYKGLTIATNDSGTFLYASNFHDGTVDVFDTSFHLVHLAGNFMDEDIPSNYAPFGIQNVNGLIYVTYAEQNSLKHDDVAGHGHGFIDVYTSNGFLIERLASHGSLNSPWGMALAPAGFGELGGALLVGDFGDGRINAFNPFNGRFLGQLGNEDNKPLTIDGLWGLAFGTASTGGTGTLLFSAGINGEQDGLLGAINPTS
jgi:uncharacterized protein (TIGR03118 family)